MKTFIPEMINAKTFFQPRVKLVIQIMNKILHKLESRILMTAIVRINAKTPGLRLTGN